MRAFVFPGQGAQFPGMGKDLFEASTIAKEMFHQANDILKFNIKDIMFGEDNEALMQTKVTQPALFIHSVILSKIIRKELQPDFVAGHSLGEFSALVASGYINFSDGLKLVQRRANAMQKSCEDNPSTMAAILGLENKIVEDVCNEIDENVKPANYNCPGQLVISGEYNAVETACQILKERGAKRALILPVSGAFHSDLMESAKKELKDGIDKTEFKKPICKIYQNFSAKPVIDPEIIKMNLLSQLTGAVLWSQSVNEMVNDGINEFVEVGPGNTLQGLIRKINPEVIVSKI